MIGLVGSLGFAIYFCTTKYLSLKDSQTQSFELKADIGYYFSLGVTWLVVGIIAAVILLIVLLLILVLIKRLRIAIQLIREASKAISTVFLTLLFPVFPLFLQLGFLAYFIANAVILSCSGTSLFKVANSTNSSSNIGDSCNPDSTTDGALCVFYRYGFDPTSVYNSVISFMNTYQWVPQLYNLFMFFWVEAFIVGFNQMVLAGKFLDVRFQLK